MRYAFVKRISFLLVLVVFLASCASSNHGMVRKCDGRRGERVGMGVL